MPIPPSPAAALCIAVLEDDDLAREKIILPTLHEHGFQAEGAATALALYRLLLGRPFDIALLDLGLPDENGLSVAAHLRSLRPGIGIVILTGSRVRAKRIHAMNVGADAYLNKPIDGELLVATLDSVARRLAPQRADAGSPASSDTAVAAAWSLQAAGWCLRMPSGQRLSLNRYERRLLMALFDARGTPVEREHLVDILSAGDPDFDPRRLEMTIHRLRRKVMAQVPGARLPLLSSRGSGYFFVNDRT